MTSRFQENKDLKEEIKKKKDIIDKLTADLENLAVRVLSLEEPKVDIKVNCNQCGLQRKNKKGTWKSCKKNEQEWWQIVKGGGISSWFCSWNGWWRK